MSYLVDSCVCLPGLVSACEFEGSGWNPRVTFIVLTFNSAETLGAMLSSIMEQDYLNYEVVIVDQDSTDGTLEIAAGFPVKVLRNSIGNYGGGCSIGLSESTGDYVAIFDSDIQLPHRRWLSNALQHFQLGQNVSTVWPHNSAPPLSGMTTRLYFNLWSVFMRDRANRPDPLFGGGNAIFLKSALVEIGGISPVVHWGADFEWANRLKTAGYQVVTLKDPIYHNTMRTFGEFARKQFWGARTFARPGGLHMMRLSVREVAFEHLVLAPKAMLKGLLYDHDASWVIYPAFLAVRLFAYSFTILKGIVAPARSAGHFEESR